MESSSSLSGSSKRAKAPGNVVQVAQCLVDGCNADLSRCREYHRRHKVCELHSKTPKVTIGGREQRFCQQCSRFHSLTEFDEVKRSCRKRLDGHNRRRRKPQPDSKSSAMVFSSQQGAKVVSFSTSQIFPTSWPVFSSNQQNSFPDSSAHNSYKVGNQFQFLQGSSEASSSAISPQPLVDHREFLSSGGPARIVDSDRALSLLSSASSVNREIGLGHHVVAQPDPQSLVHGLLYGYPFGQEIETHFHHVMQNAAPTTDGSSTSGPHQTHTFMWEQN